MEKSNSQKIQLGIFVIIGTLVFLAAIYFIGNKQNMFGNTSHLKAVFVNVNGLQPGNNVRYAGIDIGTVKEIEMINDTTISVHMIIDNKIMEHIKKNAIATISSDGLVGNMIINIIPGKGEALKVKNGDTIQSYSRIGTDAMLETLNVTNENAAMLTADLLKITQEITQGKGTVGMLIRDTVMSKNLQETMNYLRITSKGTSESVASLNKLINELKGKNFTQYLNELRINYIVSELKTNEKMRKYTIAAISEEIGFNNSETFTNAFKKITGTLPSYYIKLLNEEN